LVANQVARTVGRYEILEELGSGGMATVYLARQTDLNRLVALKELSAFRQADPAFTQRFLRESRLAGSLSHPNIVMVHDYFEADGVPYIAMEYVERGSLRPYIGHMSLTQVAGVLEGILSALEAAERRGIVHRDLKPENVMVTSDGRVKLTDFGIAKATGAAQTGSFLTATGTTVGTPNYMAPEQAMGQEVGPGTDLYSVGVMAFEFFVGRVPFSDTEEPMAVLMRQVSDPIPPARSLNPEIDQSISDWIERMVTKDPDERTGSADQAWDEFEEIVISMVGPRWRRSARLVDPSDEPARTPLMPTRKMTDSNPALAETIMPEPPTRKLETDRPERPRRRMSTAMRAGVLGVALLFALAAALGGRSSGPGGSNAANVVEPTSTVTNPDLALRVPPGWSRLRRPPDLGLPLSHATAVAPRSRSGPVVVFGVAKGRRASNGALLPARFLSSTGQSTAAVPRRSAVRLPDQNLEAWRYPGLRPIGNNRQLTVFTVPTSGGVATVACALPPAAAAAFAGQCDAIAGTLQLRRGRAYPIGPSDTYASALNATIGDLQQRSKSAEETIAGSQTLDGQAAGAQAIAEAYESAATQLAALDLSPADSGANARLVRALRGAASAYRRAAAAASAGDPDAYRAASGAVPGAKLEVNSALAGVRAAGYKPAAPSGGAPSGGGGGESESSDSGSSDSGSSEPKSSEPRSDVGDSRSDDPSDDEEEN
jgi:serine/threonine protein kinase